MLAQNFKTPADLGITDKQFDALHKVLGMLERDEIVHVPDEHDRYQFPIGQLSFNMNLWSTPDWKECGTVHCIGGWAEQIGGEPFRYAARPKALSNLFYPPSGSGYEQISTQQAAIALRNYLTHGEPRWAEALAA